MNGYGFKHRARIGAVAGMKIRHVLAEHQIFYGGKQAVENIFIGRHAAGERFMPGPDARAQDDIADTDIQKPEDIGNQAAVVLVVGVDHDDNVRAPLERLRVAGFLVSPVAAVVRMHNGVNPKGAGYLGSIVFAVIIHQNYFIKIPGGISRKVRSSVSAAL